MDKVFVLTLSFFLISSSLQGQKLEEFSSNKMEFYKELEDFMTISKRKVMEETVEEFGSYFQAGFDVAQQDTIISTCNKMLKIRLRASPYFKNYLTALVHLKSLPNSKARFYEWHEVLYGMIDDYGDKKKKKPLLLVLISGLVKKSLRLLISLMRLMILRPFVLRDLKESLFLSTLQDSF